MQTSTAGRGPRDPHNYDNGEDAGYTALLECMRDAAGTCGPIFTTDATGLYDKFLSHLPAHRRHHYVCRTCRRFVERFGGLVILDERGSARPLFWDAGHTSGFFLPAVTSVAHDVKKARITGVFLSDASLLGDAFSHSSKAPVGTWHHMYSRVVPMKKNALVTAEQVMAEKREDFATLSRSLSEFPLEVVQQAHTLLTTGGLYRSEKCIGVAKWLLDLHMATSLFGPQGSTRNARTRENVTWSAVATAPAGFCHVRSSMIGTLLADLVDSKPFEDIKRAFDAKMHPIQYQRPQATPTDGQLAEAERVVAKLASAGSLARRFATLEDIAADAIWMPPNSSSRAEPENVFGHLKARSHRGPSPIVDVSAQIITWDKFWRTVLPGAEHIECLVPSHGSFFAFVTAVDMTAPPIIQWDNENSRNPVTWYLYYNGSAAAAWGLKGSHFGHLYIPVTAITTQPSSWGGGGDHHGNGVYVVLEGCRDTRKAGLGLFPENLKAEYRGIRAAIEAYSRSREIAPIENPACGLAFQKGRGLWESAMLRVTSPGARIVYKLDRWD